MEYKGKTLLLKPGIGCTECHLKMIGCNSIDCFPNLVWHDQKSLVCPMCSGNNIEGPTGDANSIRDEIEKCTECGYKNRTEHFRIKGVSNGSEEDKKG